MSVDDDQLEKEDVQVLRYYRAKGKGKTDSKEHREEYPDSNPHYNNNVEPEDDEDDTQNPPTKAEPGKFNYSIYQQKEKKTVIDGALKIHRHQKVCRLPYRTYN